MFESVFSIISETFADHRSQKSSWGRWAGSVIIATILFVWAFLCIKQLEWIDMGPYNSLAILGIFTVLAYKSIKEGGETQSAPDTTTKEKEEIVTDLTAYGVDQVLIEKIKTHLYK